MLNACAQYGHIDKVFELFKRMKIIQLKPKLVTFLCVLYAFSHARFVNKGKHYFALMKEYGTEPRDQHYASMVDLLG